MTQLRVGVYVIIISYNTMLVFAFNEAWKKHSHKPWHHIRIMLNLSHENKLNEFIKIRQGFYGVIKKVCFCFYRTFMLEQNIFCYC